MVRMPASREVKSNRFFRPGHRRGRSSIDGISVPAFDGGAVISFGAFLGAQHVARRVTGPAMGQSFCEIGAPVPLRIMGAVRLIPALIEKQQFPDRYRGPETEWKAELICGGIRLHRRPCHYISVEGVRVRVAQPGKMVIRKDRIEMFPIKPNALPKGAREGSLRPTADPGLLVRSNIGGIHDAEGRA